jgi:hypothetical protein
MSWLSQWFGYRVGTGIARVVADEAGEGRSSSEPIRQLTEEEILEGDKRLAEEDARRKATRAKRRKGDADA